MAIREQRWGILISVAALVVYLGLFAGIKDVQPGSDGHYIWLYARSLAYDGDVDFTNDYEICGDPYGHNIDRGTGHPDNPFYVGPSIFWVPSIWITRALVSFAPGTPPDNVMGCRGPIAKVALALGSFAGALVVFFSYRAARRIARDGPAAMAAGLFAFATPLAAYSAIWCYYAHIYDALCVSALLVFSLRAYEQPRRVRRWLIAGVLLAACILHRPPNALFGVIPATLATVALWRARQWGRLALALLALGVTAALLGLLPQMMIYKYLYGHYIEEPQGRYYLQPLHSHPLLLLFAPHGGLFYMSPVAWLSVLGALATFRRHALRPLFIASLFAVVASVYIAAMPLDWHGSSSLGARRLIPITPFLVLFAARVLVPMIRWVAARRTRALVLGAIAVLLPLGFVFVGTGTTLLFGNHNYDRGLTQAEMYGDGAVASWRAVDRSIGSLALLPAELYVKFRYGLEHRAFRDATEISWYIRDYRTLGVRVNRIDLGDEIVQRLTTGMRHLPGTGARLAERRATLVFTTYWPFATQISVRASALQKTTVRVGQGKLFGGTTPFGELELDVGTTTAKLTIPPGGYDSGMNEFVFECDDVDDAEPVIQAIEFFDDNVYPPALGVLPAPKWPPPLPLIKLFPPYEQ